MIAGKPRRKKDRALFCSIVGIYTDDKLSARVKNRSEAKWENGHSPHSVGGLVPRVPVELGDPEASLGEDCEEPDRLDEGFKVPQEVHQDAPGHRQGHDALHV